MDYAIALNSIVSLSGLHEGHSRQKRKQLKNRKAAYLLCLTDMKHFPQLAVTEVTSVCVCDLHRSSICKNGSTSDF